MNFNKILSLLFILCFFSSLKFDSDWSPANDKNIIQYIKNPGDQKNYLWMQQDWDYWRQWCLGLLYGDDLSILLEFKPAEVEIKNAESVMDDDGDKNLKKHRPAYKSEDEKWLPLEEEAKLGYFYSPYLDGHQKYHSDVKDQIDRDQAHYKGNEDKSHLAFAMGVIMHGVSHDVESNLKVNYPGYKAYPNPEIGYLWSKVYASRSSNIFSRSISRVLPDMKELYFEKMLKHFFNVTRSGKTKIYQNVLYKGKANKNLKNYFDIKIPEDYQISNLNFQDDQDLNKLKFCISAYKKNSLGKLYLFDNSLQEIGLNKNFDNLGMNFLTANNPYHEKNISLIKEDDNINNWVGRHASFLHLLDSRSKFCEVASKGQVFILGGQRQVFLQTQPDVPLFPNRYAVDDLSVGRKKVAVLCREWMDDSPEKKYILLASANDFDYVSKKDWPDSQEKASKGVRNIFQDAAQKIETVGIMGGVQSIFLGKADDSLWAISKNSHLYKYESGNWKPVPIQLNDVAVLVNYVSVSKDENLKIVVRSGNIIKDGEEVSPDDGKLLILVDSQQQKWMDLEISPSAFSLGENGNLICSFVQEKNKIYFFSSSELIGMSVGRKFSLDDKSKVYLKVGSKFLTRTKDSRLVLLEEKKPDLATWEINLDGLTISLNSLDGKSIQENDLAELELGLNPSLFYLIKDSDEIFLKSALNNSFVIKDDFGLRSLKKDMGRASAQEAVQFSFELAKEMSDLEIFFKKFSLITPTKYNFEEIALVAYSTLILDQKDVYQIYKGASFVFKNELDPNFGSSFKYPKIISPKMAMLLLEKIDKIVEKVSWNEEKTDLIQKVERQLFALTKDSQELKVALETFSYNLEKINPEFYGSKFVDQLRKLNTLVFSTTIPSIGEVEDIIKSMLARMVDALVLTDYKNLKDFIADTKISKGKRGLELFEEWLISNQTNLVKLGIGKEDIFDWMDQLAEYKKTVDLNIFSRAILTEMIIKIEEVANGSALTTEDEKIVKNFYKKIKELESRLLPDEILKINQALVFLRERYKQFSSYAPFSNPIIVEFEKFQQFIKNIKGDVANDLFYFELLAYAKTLNLSDILSSDYLSIINSSKSSFVIPQDLDKDVLTFLYNRICLMLVGDGSPQSRGFLQVKNSQLSLWSEVQATIMKGIIQKLENIAPENNYVAKQLGFIKNILSSNSYFENDYVEQQLDTLVLELRNGISSSNVDSFLIMLERLLSQRSRALYSQELFQKIKQVIPTYFLFNPYFIKNKVKTKSGKSMQQLDLEMSFPITTQELVNNFMQISKKPLIIYNDKKVLPIFWKMLESRSSQLSKNDIKQLIASKDQAESKGIVFYKSKKNLVQDLANFEKFIKNRRSEISLRSDERGAWQSNLEEQGFWDEEKKDSNKMNLRQFLDLLLKYEEWNPNLEKDADLQPFLVLIDQVAFSAQEQLNFYFENDDPKKQMYQDIFLRSESLKLEVLDLVKG